MGGDGDGGRENKKKRDKWISGASIHVHVHAPALHSDRSSFCFEKFPRRNQTRNRTSTVASHLCPPNREVLHGHKSKNLPKFSCSQAHLFDYETHVFPSPQLSRSWQQQPATLKPLAVSASEGRHIKCFRMPSVESRSTGLQTDKSLFVSASASTFTSRLR